MKSKEAGRGAPPPEGISDPPRSFRNAPSLLENFLRAALVEQGCRTHVAYDLAHALQVDLLARLGGLKGYAGKLRLDLDAGFHDILGRVAAALRDAAGKL